MAFNRFVAPAVPQREPPRSIGEVPTGVARVQLVADAYGDLALSDTGPAVAQFIDSGAGDAAPTDTPGASTVLRPMAMGGDAFVAG